MDFGAGNQIRTDDLVITNDVLCQLSHTSKYSLRLDDLSIIPNNFGFVNTFFKIFFDYFFTICHLLEFIRKKLRQRG